VKTIISAHFKVRPGLLNPSESSLEPQTTQRATAGSWSITLMSLSSIHQRMAMIRGNIKHTDLLLLNSTVETYRVRGQCNAPTQEFSICKNCIIIKKM